MLVQVGDRGWAPARSQLAQDLAGYLQEWENVLRAGYSAANPRVVQLVQQAAGVQQRALALGFGGISRHLQDLCAWVQSGGHDQNELAGRLRNLRDMAQQARYEADANGGAGIPGRSGPPDRNPQGDGLAPPPLLTVRRPPQGASPGAAGAPAQPWEPNPPPPVVIGAPAAPPPLSSPPAAPPAVAGPRAVAGPSILSGGQAPPPLIHQGSAAPPLATPPPGVQPGAAAAAARDAVLPPPPLVGGGAPPRVIPAPPPEPRVNEIRGPNPAPAGPAQPAPNFAVRTMFGFRGFGSGGRSTGAQPSLPSNPGAPRGPSLLGLGGVRSNEPAPPPLVWDGKGLPPIEGGRPSRHPSDPPTGQMAEVLNRLSGESPTISPRRHSSRSMAVARRKREKPRSSWMWLIAGGGLISLVVLAVVILRPGTKDRLPPDTRAQNSVDAGVVAATLDSGTKPNDPPANETLQPEDTQRVKALLTQVHGQGGKESPELRRLLEDQAGFVARTLNTQCAAGDKACQATREFFLGGDKPINRFQEQRARWLSGWKQPSFPVSGDARVQRWFEYHVEGPVGRELIQGMLFRCGAYRDLIQATLIRHQMPQELLAIVFAESGCEPSATSPVGAAGLWQFMPDTARAYNLLVKEGVVDERRSPAKSTDAAVRFLGDLYQKLGSWDLVFASYNMGPFGLMARITRARERAGGDVTFWDLVNSDLLPDETADYVPRIQAFALILANLQKTKLSTGQTRAPQLTLELDAPPGTSLGLVARAASTSTIHLKSLNPDLVGDEVPNIPGRKYWVQIPRDVATYAREKLDELLASKDRSHLCVPPTFDWGKQRFTDEMAKACQRKLDAMPADPAPSP